MYIYLNTVLFCYILFYKTNLAKIVQATIIYSRYSIDFTTRFTFLRKCYHTNHVITIDQLQHVIIKPIKRTKKLKIKN